MFEGFSHIATLNDEKGHYIKPSPELKAAFLDKYPFIETDFIPAGYLYDILVTRSAYYTFNGNLGKIFQNLLCQHLEDENFKNTEIGRFTRIALALKREVMIPCALFYNMMVYNGGYDMIVGGRWFKRAVLERLDPLKVSNGVVEQWRVEFSTSDFGLVSQEGGLEQLSMVFSFMHY
ncbi:hypothetical protein N7523_010068 [Penicillium sp. IBT 18751x]|nr:hypothetical protein N7523_010068 [Penicillium sp. IBT 18751x]